ncbi:MAG: hypothetical protein IT325_10655 [Anaerolineae bacterium]|nr:hypothetical protein [Anaerolineae bacterium]
MAGREKSLPDTNYRGEQKLPDANYQREPREQGLPEANTQSQNEERGGRTWYFWALAGLAALVGVFVISLVAAVAIALLADPQDAANWVGLIRDVFIIVLALEGMLMGIALIVLVIQLAALVNLLQNEITPIVDNANETVSTVRGTAQFMSENLVQPVVRFTSITAGVGALLRELLSIRKSLRSNSDKR